MKRYIYLLILFSFFLSSCSSLPSVRDERTLKDRNKAIGYIDEGIELFNRGRYSQAYDLFLMSYRLNGSLDNENGIVAALNSLGMASLALGNKEDSYQFYNDAIIINGRLGDRELFHETLALLADWYIKNNEVDKSYELIKDELNAVGKANTRGEAALLHLLGLILRKKGDYEGSIAALEKSRIYNKRNKLYRPLAADHYMLASSYSLKEDYEKALEEGKMALSYDKMIEYPLGIADDLDALSIICKNLGFEEQSLIYKDRGLLVREALKELNLVEINNKEVEDSEN